MTRRTFSGAISSLTLAKLLDAAETPNRLMARPGAMPKATLEAGLHPLGLRTDRDAILYVPEAAAKADKSPLVVSLHGASGKADRGINLLRSEADKHGFLLLAPDTSRGTWDIIQGLTAGADAKFMDTALARVFEQARVDPKRIAMAGISDGGTTALSLGLANGDLFNAVLGFSPGFVVKLPPVGKPPVFISHGTLDTVLPIDETSRRICPGAKERGLQRDVPRIRGSSHATARCRRGSDEVVHGPGRVTGADLAPKRNQSGLSQLTTQERRVFTACIGGWALDAMNVQIYSFVIPALMAAWGLTKGQAGYLGTATLLVSALGGWLAGWFSDRYGRVLTLQIAIVLFAVFTFLSGLAQNYAQLFAARALLGFGFGGEWAAGAVLLGEVIRAEHRGKAVGFMQSGWAVGWAVAALLYGLFFSLMPAQAAWRALFLVGILPALLVFYVRRYVEEPAVYLESKARMKETGDRPSVLEIFRAPLLRVTLLGGLLGTGAQGGYFAVTTWLPTFLRTERKLSVLDSTGYLIVLIAGSFAGYLTGGILADKLGRRLNFLVFAIGAGVIVLTYTMVPFGDSAMLLLGFPLGFFASGVFSGMGAFFTENFPTRVRGVGQGFTYNVGRAIGALFPTLVGVLSVRMPLGQAIGLFAGIAYATMAVAAFLLPETKGKVLAA